MKKFKSFLTLAVSIWMLSLLVFSIAFAAEDVNHAVEDKFDVYTSSTIKDYTDKNKQAKHMFDKNLSTYWCAAWITETKPECDEYILFDFRDIVKIESITLTAREDHAMFPNGFTFCWSTSNEVDIPIAGAEFKDYQNADDNVNKFIFEKPIVARYLKMKINSRTPDSAGIHLVCIAEADVSFGQASEEEKKEAESNDSAVERPLVVNDPVIKYNIGTSSFLDDHDMWLPQNLTDNQLSTQWCSEWVGTTNEEDEIYVTMTFGDAQKATGVILSTQGVCFPKDFAFQYTLDNENWLDIPDSSYKDFVTDGSQKYVFPFAKPQVAKAIRIKITKKTPDLSGNYLVQLADVDVRGFTPTEEETKSAMDAFNAAIGNLPEDPNKKPTPIPATPDDFKNKGCNSVIMGELTFGVALVAAAACCLIKKGGNNE